MMTVSYDFPARRLPARRCASCLPRSRCWRASSPERRLRRAHGDGSRASGRERAPPERGTPRPFVKGRKGASRAGRTPPAAPCHAASAGCIAYCRRRRQRARAAAAPHAAAAQPRGAHGQCPQSPQHTRVKAPQHSSHAAFAQRLIIQQSSHGVCTGSNDGDELRALRPRQRPHLRRKAPLGALRHKRVAVQPLRRVREQRPSWRRVRGVALGPGRQQPRKQRRHGRRKGRIVQNVGRKD